MSDELLQLIITLSLSLFLFLFSILFLFQLISIQMSLFSLINWKKSKDILHTLKHTLNFTTLIAQHLTLSLHSSRKIHNIVIFLFMTGCIFFNYPSDRCTLRWQIVDDQKKFVYCNFKKMFELLPKLWTDNKRKKIEMDSGRIEVCSNTDLFIKIGLRKREGNVRKSTVLKRQERDGRGRVFLFMFHYAGIWTQDGKVSPLPSSNISL